MIFEVRNFNCYAECSSRAVKKYSGACAYFSYKFSSSNTYFLNGEIDCGGWAFCTAISQPSKSTLIFDSQLLVNDNSVKLEDVQRFTCDVHQDIRSKILKNSLFYSSISHLIKKYRFQKNPDELFDIFEVPKEYFSRRIKYLGEYRSVFLAMKGMIEGKRIFTTSWQGQLSHEAISTSKIANALIKTDNIFIVPTSEKNYFTGKENHISLDMLSILRLC